MGYFSAERVSASRARREALNQADALAQSPAPALLPEGIWCVVAFNRNGHRHVTGDEALRLTTPDAPLDELRGQLGIAGGWMSSRACFRPGDRPSQ